MLWINHVISAEYIDIVIKILIKHVDKGCDFVQEKLAVC